MPISPAPTTLRKTETRPAGRDRRGRLVGPLFHHQPPLRQARNRQNRREGHQPLRRRGAEGVRCGRLSGTARRLPGFHLSTVHFRNLGRRGHGTRHSCTSPAGAAVGGIQIGHSSQFFGIPMLPRGTYGYAFSRSRKRSGQPLCGAIRSRQNLQMVKMPKMRSFFTRTGPRHAMSFAGIFGLVPSSRFHSREWWAQMLRTVLKTKSHDFSTTSWTPNCAAPVLRMSRVPHRGTA